MKDVDDIGIGQALEKEQVVFVVPTGARRDDGMGRRASPDCRGQLGFHSVPAIGIVHFRLVQDFEEYAVCVPGSITARGASLDA